MTEDQETRELTAKLFTKVLDIMADIEELPKLGKAPSEMGGYAFVRDPEVKEAVRAGMIKHRLMWMPGCTGFTQDPSHTGSRLHTRASFSVTLIDCETGHTWTEPWAGEALDTQDKGLGKASTLGFKSLWRTMLLIAEDNDPDFGGPMGGSGSAHGEPAKALDDPGEYVMPITKEHKGKTLRQIANEGNQGLFQWVLDKGAGDGELQANVRAYMDVLEKAKSPETGTGGHWTETQDWKKFYTAASGLGLSNEDVHAALKVESAKDFKGSKEEAWTALVGFAVEVVKGWQNKSELLKEWFKFLNSIPAEQRPSPNQAVKMLVGDGGNLTDFDDTMAVAMNVVRGKLAPLF